MTVARTLVCTILTALIVALSPQPANALAAPDAPDPAAWILFDADTGEVLEAHSERERLSPASLTKLLTALVVVDRLDEGADIPISAAAAGRPPMKMGLQEGEVWEREILLNVMMLSSANDAAVALGEASAGSLDDFSKMRSEAAVELGLEDGPIFNDPSGLDDAVSSHNGGDLVSARDMAIIARAAMDRPDLMEIAGQKDYTYTGLTGNEWTVKNHNRFLSSYPGAIGLKTGFTRKAKHTFVGAAERDGRTLVAVTLSGPSPYPKAIELLDAGFAGEFGTGTGDTIPEASLDTHIGERIETAAGAGGLGSDNAVIGIVVALVLVGGYSFRRRREATRRLRSNERFSGY
jgi:serine-type D-Ala-D-Ala carboxypeptidase (penicillin-binding protein 5/6)